jgi:outer membrane protein assembly factor BamB
LAVTFAAMLAGIVLLGSSCKLANKTPSVPTLSGPTTGVAGVALTFTATATDPEADSVAFQFDWGDGATPAWTAFVASGDTITATNTYSDSGIFTVRAKAKDKAGKESDWSAGQSLSTSPTNLPPLTPAAPAGDTFPPAGAEAELLPATTDPDGDSLTYRAAWGDGDTSDWPQYFFPSGHSMGLFHAWTSAGTYYVSVQAKDIHGAVSGWSATTRVTVSRAVTPLWRFYTGASSAGTPAVASDGTIYVQGADSLMYAVNPDGSEKWVGTIGRGLNWTAPLTALDGTVYAPCYDGTLWALSPSGAFKWKYETGGRLTSAALGADGMVYVGSEDRYVYAVTPTCSLAWRYQTPDRVYGIALAADGTVYVTVDEQGLYALDANGSLKWFFPESYAMYPASVDADGTVYLTGHGIYAITPGGAEVWHYFADEPSSGQPTIGPDGTIYACFGGNWAFWAMRPDGTRLWTCPTRNFVGCSPAVSSTGVVYAGSADGDLYAVNGDGSVWYRYAMAEWINNATIGLGGSVYVASPDGYLYALPGSGTLADSPWPTFGHDNRHTNRAGAKR